MWNESKPQQLNNYQERMSQQSSITTHMAGLSVWIIEIVSISLTQDRRGSSAT